MNKQRNINEKQTRLFIEMYIYIFSADTKLWLNTDS